jgi:hypothetical protein
MSTHTDILHSSAYNASGRSGPPKSDVFGDCTRPRSCSLTPRATTSTFTDLGLEFTLGGTDILSSPSVADSIKTFEIVGVAGSGWPLPDRVITDVPQVQIIRPLLPLGSPDHTAGLDGPLQEVSSHLDPEDLEVHGRSSSPIPACPPVFPAYAGRATESNSVV